MDPTQQMNTYLISRCQAGDEWAFDKLYDLFGQMVWRLCMRMAGNVPDAEDFAQETWIQVWKQISTYRYESSFSTWLYKLASNACLQRLRQRDRISTCHLDDINERASDHGDPTEYMDREAVMCELRKLPELLQLPLILRANEGLSYAEIASILECTTASVKMRVARARQKLAQALEAKIK